MCAMISSSDDQSFFFFENVSDAYTRICLDCCPRAHQLKMANSKWALIQSDNETQGLTRPASRPHLDRIGEPMLVVALQEGKSIMKDFRFPQKKTRHPKRPFKDGTFFIDCFFSYSNYFSFFSYVNSRPSAGIHSRLPWGAGGPKTEIMDFSNKTTGKSVYLYTRREVAVV